ncbi:MAG TPA: insulinase family protein [Gemmatimonadales bacterium]
MRLVAAVALLFALPLTAQQPRPARRPTVRPAASAAPAEPAGVPLQADTNVHSGRLANGLQYWIQRNTYPAHRLELRLVVRAGSILEDQDQRGLAHFIEHMGFNGTTHFARNELVSYLESIGVRFGADLNANTVFDETTYILPVPSDKPAIVDRAFDILQDWAAGDQFDPANVKSERGVIMGEWRNGLGAESRIANQEIPLLFKGSRYAVRLPIGDTGIINHATPAPLKRFYHDWYRPDLMAVIAVGDYPVDSLRALITDRFAGLKNPVPERRRVDAPVPLIPGTRVAILTDPEVTTESIQLLVRRPSVTFKTENDERRVLVNAIFSNIAAQRVQLLARKPDAPFVSAGFGPSGFIRDLQVFGVSVNAKQGRSAAAFEATLRELRRLQEHGVLPAELDRTKAAILRGRENAASETGKTESDVLVGGLISAYLYGTVPVAAHERYELAKRILPTITAAEVDSAVRDASRGNDRFIAVIAPDSARPTLPRRDTLLAILARTDTATLVPWTEEAVATTLVPSPPVPGRVVSETTYTSLGISDWRLSNGVRVLIKPTQFKLDQVIIAGGALGGTSLLSDADVLNGSLAPVLVRQSGIGDFDAVSLSRKLAGTIAVTTTEIDNTSEGVFTLTSPKDLETGLEVQWLTLTQPRLDTTAIHALINQVRSQIAHRSDDPTTVFRDTLAAVLTRHSPRAAPITMARLDSLNPQRALAIYRDWFHTFGDFTFVIVGNVHLDSLRPLVAHWLGGLPTDGSHRMWRDIDSLPPDGIVNRVVYKGKEPVAQQTVYFNGPLDSTQANALAGAAAGAILQQRLLDSLRQAMGATYGVSVDASTDRFPRIRYRAEIDFKSSPGQADTLWQAAQRIIAALRATGPTPDELEKFVAQQRREDEVGVSTNDWWLGEISDYVMADGSRTGQPLTNIMQWGRNLDALTPALVQQAAQRYFNPERVARFVLLPEH